MGIKLEKRTSNDVVGKPAKFTAIFKGDYKGLDVTFKVEGETERDVRRLIPLVPERVLELDVIDFQSKIDEFEEKQEAATAKAGKRRSAEAN